jgi:hypothetical protein
MRLARAYLTVRLLFCCSANPLALHKHTRRKPQPTLGTAPLDPRTPSPPLKKPQPNPEDVVLHITYHVLTGETLTLTLQPRSHFEELLEQWKAFMASKTARLPRSVIPPHQFMFIWEGRPLKVNDTPAGLGMSRKEAVYVLDSMDAARALRVSCIF